MLDSPAIDLIASARLFHGLDQAALHTIGALAFPRKASAGQTLFFQDDPADSLWILLQGRVRLVQLTPDGQQVVLRFVTPGELLGGIALFGEKRYPATAHVVEAATALGWDGRAMSDLLPRYPILALNAMQLLAGRVQELQDRNRELSTERVERRLARALLRLVQQAGRRVNGGVLIDLPLSRQDLGEMNGTTLYTVSRILSRWQERGLVEASRERVLICSPHDLVAIAEDLLPAFRTPPSPPS